MQLGKYVTAVVAGGASGLGEAAAGALAARGAQVAVFDMNAAAGEKVASAIGGLYCHCDVTSDKSVREAFSRVRAEFGQERILVNCAGIAIAQRTVRREKDSGGIVMHDLASFARCVEVNLIGTFNVLTQAAAGMMATEPITPDGERGVIINTSSVAAEDGQLGQAAYAASKGGVRSLTLPVARDLAKDGIRVATILPGLFETPMFGDLPDAARQALAAQVPFPPRLGAPDEFAQLVLHICENSMINGTDIRLDGALRLPPR